MTCVVLLALAIIAPLTAKAQLAGNGAISGTVTDPSGAVIPNATITVLAVDTNQATVRHSTSAGDYNVTPLPPGNYSVTVTAPGFESFVQQNVTVNGLETFALNMKMTIGAAGQTVPVSALPPNLTTTDATLGGAMENVMYSNLPFQMSQGGAGTPDQRRATDFEYLMPGVQNNWVGSTTVRQPRESSTAAGRQPARKKCISMASICRPRNPSATRDSSGPRWASTPSPVPGAHRGLGRAVRRPGR